MKTLFSILICLQLAEPAFSADVPDSVARFLNRHCLSCHGDDQAEADVDLRSHGDQQMMLQNRDVWLLHITATIRKRSQATTRSRIGSTNNAHGS